ncbi:thermonuclease family protein [Desulfocapsa sp. AH-315-G09]|uniref:Thermonuclease family protein n=1 Tax=Desulfotalea psychrophila TaxID=84980 RepID=A0ABS3ASI1_9BACT|nr:thermonuclease family protein [Desulfocapsa sp.]MBN4065054.1 thermonuclease family protein [Desulfocapsa sp. AH-315-G09]MBN4068076.1 thermonuclease family protein [Desulfotalea psychrophila]
MNILSLIFPVVASILCLPALADSSSEKYENFYNVQFVKNYDGDSITFNIPNTPAIVGKNMVIRLRGIDTPELKKKTCTAEKEKALQAKRLVHSLLKNAKAIHLHRIGRGKYFRMLADVDFDGQDLATVLLNRDLAVKYSGGKKDFSWCRESSNKISVRHNSKSVLPPKISGVYVWPPPPVQKPINKKNTK